MEVDAINAALASRSTTALDQQRLGVSNRPSRSLDLSQEHTNGRMFEQAVQNANKAGETSASSSLILNQKDARMVRQQIEPIESEEEGSGQICLKMALKTFGINYEALCQLSHDTILVKGKAIDMLMDSVARQPELDGTHASENLKLGASSNISENQIRRDKVNVLAEEAYGDIVHLEVEQGNLLHTSIVQGQSEAAFGKEVVSLIFDRPSLILKASSK